MVNIKINHTATIYLIHDYWIRDGITLSCQIIILSQWSNGGHNFKYDSIRNQEEKQLYKPYKW